jgi:protoheme IX farnesyltransferase
MSASTSIAGLPSSRGTASLPSSTAGDWVQLLKPRVLVLVVYTAVAGLAVAPVPMHPVLAFAAILAITVAAGAAGALNMWFDRDIDAVMARTARRPIPAGRIGADEALTFGVMLAVASVMVMALTANLAAAAWLAMSILFYVLVYTVWLKRRTAQNIVIGGAAGAFPPIIGWVAATGHLALLPVLMFAIVFVWTPPHFWSLALYASGDYARAGVPMLPVVSGARTTRAHILAYTVLLVSVSVSPWVLGLAGPLYGAVALVLGMWFAWHAVRVWRDQADASGRSRRNDEAARAAFRFSILYLFVLFGALVADHWVFHGLAG